METRKEKPQPPRTIWSVFTPNQRVLWKCEAGPGHSFYYMSTMPSLQLRCYGLVEIATAVEHWFIFSPVTGHRNIRYFLSLLLYLSVCGIYINVINFEFAYDVLGGFEPRTIIAMLLPWVAWLLGK